MGIVNSGDLVDAVRAEINGQDGGVNVRLHQQNRKVFSESTLKALLEQGTLQPPVARPQTPTPVFDTAQAQPVEAVQQRAEPPTSAQVRAPQLDVLTPAAMIQPT